MLAGNVLALGEELDLEAQNCLPALNLIRSPKFQIRTVLPNSCSYFCLLAIFHL
jgi:hypothetical protein